MSQAYTMHPFDYVKNKISESSYKLFKYIIWTTVIGLIVGIILVISFYILLVPLGFTLQDFDTNNFYTTGQTILDSGIFLSKGGIITVIFLSLAVIALIVVLIMTYIQYYKLGSAFNRLYIADSSIETPRFISYGFYGYVIAIIIGIFVPGIAGSIVSILGNVSLAIAAYLIYRLFTEYRDERRFNAKPSILLFIGLAINIVTNISSMFSTWGSFGTLIGFILMLLGFRDLSRDIKIVSFTRGQQIGSQYKQQTQQIGPTKTAYSPQDTSKKILFCPNCGAKLADNAKFCANCGSTI